MMRLRCRNCETAFDYEKHEGYCPRCGSFNEKPVKPVRVKKEKRNAATGKERRRRLFKRWMIGVVAALFLLPIAGAPIVKYMGEQTYNEVRADRIETEEAAIGETVEIGEYEYTTLNTEWHAMKIDRQFLRVEYQLHSDLPHPGDRLQYTTKVYLYADGEYVLPYNSAVTLRNQLSEEDEYKDQIYDDKYTAYLNQEYGNLAFITPVDVEEAHLLIVVYDRADDGTGSGPPLPVQKIRIPVQETQEVTES